MFDLSNLPPMTKAKVETFTGVRFQDGTGAPEQTGWFPWTRPKNASLHMFLCLGGGAGGGAGASGSTLTSRTGGAGGGCGGFARLLIASNLLPRELYLFPGFGGRGGVTGVSGGVGANGGKCAITDRPDRLAVQADTILQSGNNSSAISAFGGNGGTAVQSGGGAGEPIAVNTLGVYQGLGLWFAKSGIAGANGGPIGAVGDSTPAFGSAGVPLTSGAGGGSISAADAAFDGGAITGAGRIITIPGGVAGTAGEDGRSGILTSNPWQATGGSGGAAGTVTGGRGGNAAIGCGGGGGGGSVTGGNGGNGGPGMIIVVTW